MGHREPDLIDWRAVRSSGRVSSAAALFSLLIIVLYVLTTVIYGAADPVRQSPLPASAPDGVVDAFGVEGTGTSGICAEIEHGATSPNVMTNCKPVILERENFDLDHLSRPTSADLLVENSILRAGARASFRLLVAQERPSYQACTASRHEPLFWVPFSALPGRTLCVRTDEGRVGIIQVEDARQDSVRVRARLTVWHQS